MIKPTWLPVFVSVKNVLIVGLSFVMIYLIWVSWITPKPVDTDVLLADMRAKIFAEWNKDVKSKEVKIKELDKIIKDQKNRLVVSVTKQLILEKKLKEINDEKIARVPPKTNEDIRKRLAAFGINTF